jgi:hypothetical protein
MNFRPASLARNCSMSCEVPNLSSSLVCISVCSFAVSRRRRLVDIVRTIQAEDQHRRGAMMMGMKTSFMAWLLLGAAAGRLPASAGTTGDLGGTLTAGSGGTAVGPPFRC